MPVETIELPEYKIVHTLDGNLKPCWRIVADGFGHVGNMYTIEDVERWKATHIKEYVPKRSYVLLKEVNMFLSAKASVLGYSTVNEALDDLAKLKAKANEVTV